jgi:hypothetical protein
MLLLSLSVFSASSDEVEFNSKVLHLTDLPPNDGTSYFVMIHKNGCSHCVQLAPSWNAAAEIGEGLTKWAELNCDLNHTACASLKIESVPQTWLFLKGTVYPYTGMQLARLFANYAAVFVHDSSILVDDSNFTVNASTNAAILFTDKRPTPRIWMAIASVVNRTDVGYYVCRDPAVKARFGLADETFSAVYGIKAGKFEKYSNAKLTVADAAAFLNNLFESKPIDL